MSDELRMRSAFSFAVEIIVGVDTVKLWKLQVIGLWVSSWIYKTNAIYIEQLIYFLHDTDHMPALPLSDYPIGRKGSFAYCCPK